MYTFEDEESDVFVYLEDEDEENAIDIDYCMQDKTNKDIESNCIDPPAGDTAPMEMESSDQSEASGEDNSDSSSETDSESRSESTLECIENMVLEFLTQLLSAGEPKGNKKNNRSESEQAQSKSHNIKFRPKIELQLVDRRKYSTDGEKEYRYIRFPKKCASGSARPLAQLFKILDIAHEAIVDDIPVTKRDIYYRDVQLFKSQKVVDALVDDLAATFELERSDLNIRATSKGLICGSSLTINLKSGVTIQANDTDGTLIPVGEDILSFSLNNEVLWVLIVEKDAVFQTLCRLRLANHPALPGRGLMITGKGYPDIATRHLVKTLADALPRCVPILGFVDGDPFGLDILSVYKYGSRNLQHESDKLATGRIKWLGLLASELISVGIDRDKLLKITKQDEKKAFAMLRRPTSTLPAKWKRELMHTLHTRRKAEIEILSSAKLESNAPPYFPNLQKQADQPFWGCTIENSDMLSHPGLELPSSSPSTPSTIASYSYFDSQASTCATLGSFGSSQIFASTAEQPTPPRAPLLRYLSNKITDAVTACQARGKSFKG